MFFLIAPKSVCRTAPKSVCRTAPKSVPREEMTGAKMTERPTFRVVTEPEGADPDSLCVMLFEEGGEAMGWFIGPVVLSNRSRVSMPYLPKSARRRIATALVTAMGTAMVERLDVCVVDPLDLLATV